jgi:hypothetical protein
VAADGLVPAAFREEAKMPVSSVLFLIAVGLVVTGLISYRLLAARRRREELSAWAAEHGLSFSSDGVSNMAEAYPEFADLRAGMNQLAYNRMEGQWSGRRFRAFDYVTVDGKSRISVRFDFSAVIVESPLPLKRLLIQTEKDFDHVAEFFGAEGIQFESAEFSRAFHVLSADRKWAYDVLHPRAMEFLLSMPRFEIQFDEKTVMVHRASTFSLQDFEAAAKVAQGLLDGLPEYVKQQQRAHA